MRSKKKHRSGRDGSQTTEAPWARTWGHLLDLEPLGLKRAYRQAVVTMAAIQADSEAENLRKHPPPPPGPDEIPPPPVPVPDLSDPLATFEACAKGDKPAWWPVKLHRMAVKINSRALNEAPTAITSAPFDPDAEALGETAFSAVTRQIADQIGTPFEGNIHIEIQCHTLQRTLAGFRGQVEVGDQAHKGGDDGDDFISTEVTYLRKALRDRDAANIEIFRNASNVIHASAAAINAARGVNYAPPWMQGGEDDMPTWARMLLEAGQMAMEYWTGRNVGSTPRNNRRRIGPGAENQQRRLPDGEYPSNLDPAGPPPDELGYDQYRGGQQEEFEDDVRVSDEMLVDEPDAGEGQAQPDEETEPSDDGTPEEDENEEKDASEEEEDEGADKEGDDEEEDDDPFKGLDDEAAFEAISRWIDQHPNREKVKKMGMKLIPKVMGPGKKKR